MEPGVDESWGVIAAWLAGNAPAELALAQPPAEAEDVLEAEQLLGMGLLVVLLAWWERVDGLKDQSSLVPPRYRPYSVREELDKRDVWMSAWNGVMEELAAEQQPPVDFAV